MTARFTHTEMAEELAKMVYAKATWLSDFSTGRNKRPDHEIQNKTKEFAVLQQAEASYRRMAERKSA